MKISISLPDDDVAYLDHIAAQRDHGNRSAVLHEAVNVLRERDLSERDLSETYEQASKEWGVSGDDAAWDGVAADGIE